jgi:hypothetical protein
MSFFFAFLDLITGTIIPRDELLTIKQDLAPNTPMHLFLEEFDVKGVHKGDGHIDGVATECDGCGGGMGTRDPDLYMYVTMGTCVDCWEG